MQKKRRDNFHDRRGPEREKKGWKLSLFPTLSPAREPLVRYLQVKVQVRAMSEPGISLHPISETDEEMTTRSRARSQLGKSSIITWGKNLLLSISHHISHTRGKKRNKRKSVKEKKTFFGV